MSHLNAWAPEAAKLDLFARLTTIRLGLLGRRVMSRRRYAQDGVTFEVVTTREGDRNRVVLEIEPVTVDGQDAPNCPTVWDLELEKRAA